MSALREEVEYFAIFSIKMKMAICICQKWYPAIYPALKNIKLDLNVFSSFMLANFPLWLGRGNRYPLTVYIVQRVVILLDYLFIKPNYFL